MYVGVHACVRACVHACVKYSAQEFFSIEWALQK